MGTSVSRAAMAHVRAFAASIVAFLLALGLAPATSLAEEPVAASFAQVEASSGVASTLVDQVNDFIDSSAGSQQVSASQDAGASRVAPMLASGLFGSPAGIVSSDVALDASDPVVGSFTVDGLTFALSADGVTLVAVSHDAIEASDPDGGRGEVGTSEPSAPSGSLAIPSQVTYGGATYDVTAIGPYSFYLSGATSVELPDSILSVDSRAFRSSDVARIDVAPGNPNIASYDGALYSADLTSLLLIPEGRAGSVPIPSEAEVVDASKFSHCSLVDAISVDGDGAAFASWEGLLYSADGTTLLRVPAGATEITIRDGCTTIAAGALEGCAKLERINAPASVTSISPDVFTSIPTVSLPAQMAVQDEASSGVASGLPDQVKESTDSASQLTAMVALTSREDAIPNVEPSQIVVSLPAEACLESWRALGLTVEVREGAPEASVMEAGSGRASGDTIFATLDGGGGSVFRNDGVGLSVIAFVDGAGMIMGTPASFLQVHYHYPIGTLWVAKAERPGYTQTGWTGSGVTVNASTGSAKMVSGGYYTATWTPNKYSVALDAQGGSVSPASIAATYDQDATLPAPTRSGYKFLGWNTAADGSGTTYQPGTVRNLTADDGATVTLYAQWKVCEIGFDTDSEPDDADYPGVDKDPISAPDAVGPDGTIQIEDPKRPGYVFEGWVIPTEDGTKAVDQELVYQGSDGKWYVDASKLPDYAGDDGRVELTARWTSVISVDVPSSVTFHADLVTQGQESREGAASSAFGQNKLSNQSQVDLRVVGLESSAVKTTDTTLGADSILKKKDGSAVSGTGDKLLSLYPTTGDLLDEGDLRDPDAVSASKPGSSVDFSLDDILLEGSFTAEGILADAFTIAAGDTLNMGYRLNLAETDTELDYDKLSTLSEGQSASIANVSYCFAADALPSDWDEPLWVENPDRASNPAKYLLLKDIKAAANDLSANGTASEYYSLYKGLLDAQVTNNGNPGVGPYFQLKVDGVYLPLQLIGICQDTKSDGTGKAGLTFQMRDVYAASNTRCSAAGGGTFNAQMNSAGTNSGGWQSSAMRSTLRSTFWGYLPAETQAAIVEVDKFQQLYIGPTFDSSPSYLQKTMGETIWIPSMFEVFGTTFEYYNDSEALTSVSGYAPFQYMAYAPGGTGTINTKAIKRYNGSVSSWWCRSAHRCTTYDFGNVNATGTRSPTIATYLPNGTAPCFCL